MHFHADHSLFFEQRQPLWRSAASLAVVSCVLIVNTWLSNTTVSLSGSGIATLLLITAYARGHRRIEPALTWALILVVSVLLGGVALQGQMSLFTETAARISCGVLWVLWLGTELDWASLRQMLIAIGIPHSIIGSLDHAVMNGILTQKEWKRRRDTARLRLGKSRLPLRVLANVLGDGALTSFYRLESVEENALLRSANSALYTKVHGIELDGVSVERSGQKVLEDLHFSVPAGAWLLVCGPSGAGKTSLLRLMAGIDAPSKGTISRLGVTLAADVPLKGRLDGRVALLSQNPEHHFIASTVAEDIAWGLLRRNVDIIEAYRRAEEMAKAMGLEHLLQRPCHTLSFGEQRRVALAGLLVLEPKLLLLDEPTSGLDPVAAHELRTIVNQLVQSTGAACIWATHDLHTLPTQANRVLFLNKGRVVFDGATEIGLSETWLLKAGLMAPPKG